MRGTNAKLLRRLSRFTPASHRQLKRSWTQIPKRERAQARRDAERHIEAGEALLTRAKDVARGG